MANFDQVDTGAITGDATTTIVDVQGVANGLGLTLYGTFVVDVQIEISFDGTEFVAFEAVKSAPGHYPIAPCHSVRLTSSTYVSGTAQYRIGGLRSVDD